MKENNKKSPSVITQQTNFRSHFHNTHTVILINWTFILFCFLFDSRSHPCDEGRVYCVVITLRACFNFLHQGWFFVLAGVTAAQCTVIADTFHDIRAT